MYRTMLQKNTASSIAFWYFCCKSELSEGGMLSHIPDSGFVLMRSQPPGRQGLWLTADCSILAKAQLCEPAWELHHVSTAVVVSCLKSFGNRYNQPFWGIQVSLERADCCVYVCQSWPTKCMSWLHAWFCVIHLLVAAWEGGGCK